MLRRNEICLGYKEKVQGSESTWAEAAEAEPDPINNEQEVDHNQIDEQNTVEQ